MNSYAQAAPQSQAPGGRIALWMNRYKNAANQPDLKGNLEISYALAVEIMQAFQAGSYTQDRRGTPVVKVDCAVYAQNSANQSAPALSGPVSTLADTAASAQRRQANQAAPSQAVPVQAAPVQAAPSQAAPVQAAPVQAAPVQAAPVQFPPAPVQGAVHAQLQARSGAVIGQVPESFPLSY